MEIVTACLQLPAAHLSPRPPPAAAAAAAIEEAAAAEQERLAQQLSDTVEELAAETRNAETEAAVAEPVVAAGAA
eukprot:SAG25_NODE_8604_length_414_cov_0.380952_1_plen_74_part_10